jgi:hypothetical protein
MTTIEDKVALVAEQVVLVRDGGALDVNCGITMHQNTNAPNDTVID